MCHENIFCHFMSFKAPWDQTWLLFLGCSWKPDTSLPSPCTPVCLDFHQLIHSPSLQSEDAQIQGMNTVIWGVHSSVQLLSHVWLFVTPWTAAHQASLSFTISQNLLKLMSIESVILSSHLILCHPLLLLPSILPIIRVFFNELALCIMWPKDWNFSFSINPSNEYSGLIFFRIDWFDLLAVQRTLKSLL